MNDEFEWIWKFMIIEMVYSMRYCKSLYIHEFLLNEIKERFVYITGRPDASSVPLSRSAGDNVRVLFKLNIPFDFPSIMPNGKMNMRIERTHTRHIQRT